MVKRSNNPLFSRPVWLGGQGRRVTRLKRIAWDRLSKEKRRKVAIAAGVSEKIAGVWAQIRWRDIPEGWKDALLSNLEAARNPMKKRTRKKKKATRKVARRPRTTTRKKKNSRGRRRNRTVNFPFPVTRGQAKKLKSFLSRLTGKRVKLK